MAPGSSFGMSHLSARSGQDAIDHTHRSASRPDFPGCTSGMTMRRTIRWFRVGRTRTGERHRLASSPRTSPTRRSSSSVWLAVRPTDPAGDPVGVRAGQAMQIPEELTHTASPTRFLRRGYLSCGGSPMRRLCSGFLLLAGAVRISTACVVAVIPIPQHYSIRSGECSSRPCHPISPSLSGSGTGSHLRFPG